jgi:hypothetical protein
MKMQWKKWKKVKRFPLYEVSEFGDVRRGNRQLKLHVDKWGYQIVSLMRLDGTRGTVKAHRIVAEAFLGDPPFEGAQACHNDSVKANNHYSNLRWDTPKGNVADKSIAGTENIGVRNGKARLTESDVVEIRRLVSLDLPTKMVGAEFGVSQQTVSKIANRKLWPHVA